MKFLLACFLIVIGFTLLFRLFGGLILKYILKMTVLDMEKQFKQQSSRFHNPFDSNFEKEVHVGDDLIIKVPHQENPPKHKNNAHIEYIDVE